MLADPGHRWTRAEQVAFAMEGEPVGPPGGLYHYSDTGYVLLGDIVERTTSLGLGAALRSLLRWDELGLRHTYLESVDPVPASAPPRIHQFFGEIDTYGFDPSMDLYGGGGLVSTLADLATFFEALLGGEVFDDPATLTAMLRVPPTNAEAGAASGLFRIERDGHTCWGHEGFWGVSVQRCPDADLTVVRSVSQAVPPEGLSAGLTALVTELLAGA